MAAILAGQNRCAATCSARSVAANCLLRPQPLVPRRAFRQALRVDATTKAPAQPVRITIQGRRLPVRCSVGYLLCRV